MLKEIGKDMAMKYKFIIDHNREKGGKYCHVWVY